MLPYFTAIEARLHHFAQLLASIDSIRAVLKDVQEARTREVMSGIEAIEETVVHHVTIALTTALFPEDMKVRVLRVILQHSVVTRDQRLPIHPAGTDPDLRLQAVKALATGLKELFEEIGSSRPGFDNPRRFLDEQVQRVHEAQVDLFRADSLGRRDACFSCGNPTSFEAVTPEFSIGKKVYKVTTHIHVCHHLGCLCHGGSYTHMQAVATEREAALMALREPDLTFEAVKFARKALASSSPASGDTYRDDIARIKATLDLDDPDLREAIRDELLTRLHQWCPERDNGPRDYTPVETP